MPDSLNILTRVGSVTISTFEFYEDGRHFYRVVVWDMNTGLQRSRVEIEDQVEAIKKHLDEIAWCKAVNESREKKQQ